jgi:hypothetical protein
MDEAGNQYSATVVAGPMTTGVPVPRDQAPVEAQSQRLQQGVDQLHAAISNIEDRLGSCLTPSQPRDEAGVASLAEEPTAPLTSTVRAWVAQIEHATKRIEEIRSRVEL